ncbi:MAG: efflux RND transporter periplasmic adaptor subunit [Deltaproteobacteria bacterium]|nr:efflux RND transporter periplasmic adaptor subunit [Deltaproteobacteria bacterium]
MKRALVLFVVLVTVLSVLLYLRLRQQRLDAERASGGSATVEGTKVDVVSRLPARIEAVRVQAGDEVKQGQELVLLDCAEPRALLAQAEAALEGARAAQRAAETSEKLAAQGVRGAGLALAMSRAAALAAEAQKRAADVQRGATERASQRTEAVHLVGGVSDQALDQTQSTLAGLDQQLVALDANAQAARERSAASGTERQAAVIKGELAGVQTSGAAQQVKAAQAARDRAALAVAECTLRAPRDGYVQERNYEPGEVVLPGSRVLSLVDIREVRATFYIPNAELAAARPGRKVELRADAYPARIFAGQIRRVGVQAEFTPRNVQTRQDRDRLVYAVEVAAPNAERLLRPGMPVEIAVPGSEGGAR